MNVPFLASNMSTTERPHVERTGRIHLTREMLSTEALCGRPVPAGARPAGAPGAAKSHDLGKNGCAECLAWLDRLPVSRVSAFHIDEAVEGNG